MNNTVRFVRGGFILFETMLSLFILVVVSIVSMSYAVDLYMRTTHALAMQQQNAQLAMILDLIADDLACAPMDKAAWKRATAQQTIWATAYGDVGFENTDKGIVRSQGVFDYTGQRWVKRTRSYLPPGIWYQIDVASDDSMHIFLVDLTVWTTDKRQAATTVALRSGARL